MSAVFVHLSDIHFGQEKDDRIHIHDDVKRQLIADAAEVVASLPARAAFGILVTGDVAHSGSREEYATASVWLDLLAHSVGCEIFRIQVVPGNHDVDRSRQSMGADHLLDVIRRDGAAAYERVLANEFDRAALFARFENYARFCEGYDCALDVEGRHSADMRVELAPGRSIRFVRMNSSLLCTGGETDTAPELMIGARQYTVPTVRGEEAVVLVHHPLHWCRDGEEAFRYVSSRARVMISGHEHNPAVRIHNIEIGSDLLALAAGATVPFKSDGDYTFTYNVIEFAWDGTEDALCVTIHPRAWNPARTRFEADERRLGGKDPRFVLGSPNFRRYATGGSAPPGEDRSTIGEAQPVAATVAAPPAGGRPAVPAEVEGYRLVLLRFFRDLTEGERLRILVALGALDGVPDERMTRSVERRMLDWLVARGHLGEVRRMIEQVVTEGRIGIAK